MAAARGAISSAANEATCSRSMSAVSPRSKSRPGTRFGRVDMAHIPPFARPRQADHDPPSGETPNDAELRPWRDRHSTARRDGRGQNFDRTVARFGDRPGLVVRSQGVRWSVCRIWRARVDAVAAGLIALGLVARRPHRHLVAQLRRMDCFPVRDRQSRAWSWSTSTPPTALSELEFSLEGRGLPGADPGDRVQDQRLRFPAGRLDHTRDLPTCEAGTAFAAATPARARTRRSRSRRPGAQPTPRRV